MGKDVFLSYSRKDYIDENNVVIPGNIVQKVKKALEDNGISFWFDEEGIYSGESFAPVIAKGIRESVVFLFISTRNSNASEWTSAEIATARSYGKRIIPFRYDDSNYNDAVILHLSYLDHIEYWKNHEKAMARLIESIRNGLREEQEKAERLREERNVKEQQALAKAQREKDLAQIRTQMEAVRNEREAILSKLKGFEESVAQVKSELEMIDSGYRDLQAKESALLDNDFDKRRMEVYGEPEVKEDGNVDGLSLSQLFAGNRKFRLLSVIAGLALTALTVACIILAVSGHSGDRTDDSDADNKADMIYYSKYPEAIEFLDTHDVWNKWEMEKIPGLEGIWDMLNEYRLGDTVQQLDLSGSERFRQLFVSAQTILSRGGDFEGRTYCTRRGDYDISYNRYNRVLMSKIIEMDLEQDTITVQVGVDPSR